MITNNNDEFHNLASVKNNDKKCGPPGGEILWTLEKVQYTEMKRLIATLCLYYLSCYLTFCLHKIMWYFHIKETNKESHGKIIYLVIILRIRSEYCHF